MVTKSNKLVKKSQNFMKKVTKSDKLPARKTTFYFYKCSKKIIFPKKLHWNMTFLVSSGKMIVLFPQKMILFFWWKMKDDLSQKKKYMEI